MAAYTAHTPIVAISEIVRNGRRRLRLGLFPMAPGAHAQASPEFHFVQLSDTHWGFKGAPNPDAEHTLGRRWPRSTHCRARPISSSSPATSPTPPTDPKERRTKAQALQGDRLGAARQGRALHAGRA